jgi:cysteinyl-tRNA synthetase
LTYSEDGLDSAERSLQRLINSLRNDSISKTNETLSADDYKNRFMTAMEDDLNTPQALASLFDLAREINRSKEKGISVVMAQVVLKELALVLGLSLEEDITLSTSDSGSFIDLLVNVRSQLRADGQWTLGDSIRDQLQALGVSLEDSAGGTNWRFVSKG